MLCVLIAHTHTKLSSKQPRDFYVRLNVKSLNVLKPRIFTLSLENLFPHHLVVIQYSVTVVVILYYSVITGR